MNMNKKGPQTANDVIRAIIEKPVQMFFSVRMTGMLKDVDRAGVEILHAGRNYAVASVNVLVSFINATAALVKLAFYPITRTLRFVRMRREIMANPDRFRVQMDGET